MNSNHMYLMLIRHRMNFPNKLEALQINLRIGFMTIAIKKIQKNKKQRTIKTKREQLFYA